MNYKVLWYFGMLVGLMGVVGLAAVGFWWGLGSGLSWVAVTGFTGLGVFRQKAKGEALGGKG